MSVNVSMMENKVAKTFTGIDKIQTSLIAGSTQNWVPENEANQYIKTKSLSVSDNGEYSAEDEDVDAFSEVKVNVADPQYSVGHKEIKENGIYQASADGYDAYSEVKVEVDVPVEQFGDYTLSWSKVSDTGTGNVTLAGSVVEWNGAIYIYDTTGAFKSFNGTSWTTLTGITGVSAWAFLTVYNNQIHGFYGTSHYIWNGSAWTLVAVSNPTNFNRNTIVAFESGGLLHVLYDNGGTRYHYTWNGTAWGTMTSTFTGTAWYGSCAYKIGNDQHVVVSGVDYKYSGDAFTQTANWASNYVWSVGKFEIYEMEKAAGCTEVRNSVYQVKSSNGRYTRWDENPAGRPTGYISSISKVLYFLGKNAVYQATVIQQEE